MIPSDDTRIGEVLMVYLGAAVRLLLDQDPRVREAVPEGVHQMRVATRRLRSALGTFRSVLEADAASGLREELRWLAGMLGAVRDLQVLQERLRDRLAREPAELVIGPVSRRIDERLDADIAAGQLVVIRALDGQRYRALLGELAELLASPPMAESAELPADRMLPVLLSAERARLRRAVLAARKAPPGPDRDAALHEVRKAAKRLRYAAELAAPVTGELAELLAASAEEVQGILGGHHDGIVARELLRRLAAEAQERGESAFSYGRLDALEQVDIAAAEARFERAWHRFPKRWSHAERDD